MFATENHLEKSLVHVSNNTDSKMTNVGSNKDSMSTDSERLGTGSNDGLPPRVSLQESTERSHFYTLDADCEQFTDRPTSSQTANQPQSVLEAAVPPHEEVGTSESIPLRYLHPTTHYHPTSASREMFSSTHVNAKFTQRYATEPPLKTRPDPSEDIEDDVCESDSNTRTDKDIVRVEARVEPTGSENNILSGAAWIAAALPSQSTDNDEPLSDGAVPSEDTGSVAGSEVTLGTRGSVEGSDLTWNPAVTRVIGTVRPPLVGQSEENSQGVPVTQLQITKDRIGIEDLVQDGIDVVDELVQDPKIRTPEPSGKVCDPSSLEDSASNASEAVDLLVLDVGRVHKSACDRCDRDKFLKESNYQLVLVNKDLLQMSSPEPSGAELDLPGSNGADSHVERHLSSPSVVSASSFSSSRLEWDSGADVGYGGPRVIYGLSTLERMAIGSYASVLRMEPEGTSSLCRDITFQQGPLPDQGTSVEGGLDLNDGQCAVTTSETTSDVSSDDTNDDIERTRRSILQESLLKRNSTVTLTHPNGSSDENENKDDFKLSFHRSLPVIPKRDPSKRKGSKSLSLTDLSAAASRQGYKLSHQRDVIIRKLPEMVLPSSSDSNSTITGQQGGSSPFCSTAVGHAMGLTLQKPYYATPESDVCGTTRLNSLQDNPCLEQSPLFAILNSQVKKSLDEITAAPSDEPIANAKLCLNDYSYERMKEHVSNFVGNIFNDASAEQKLRIAEDLLKIITQNHPVDGVPSNEIENDKKDFQQPDRDVHAMPSNSNSAKNSVIVQKSEAVKLLVPITTVTGERNSSTTNDTESSSVKTAVSGYDNEPRNVTRSRRPEGNLTSSFEFCQLRAGPVSAPLKSNKQVDRKLDVFWRRMEKKAIVPHNFLSERSSPSVSEESSPHLHAKTFHRKSLRRVQRASSQSEMTSEGIPTSYSTTTNTTSRSQTSSKDTMNTESSFAGLHASEKSRYNFRSRDVEMLKALVQKQRHQHIRRLEQEVQWLERIENILTVNTGGFSGLKRIVGDLQEQRGKSKYPDDARRSNRRREKKKGHLVASEGSSSLNSDETKMEEEVRNFGQTFPSPVPIETVASVAVQTSMLSSTAVQDSDRRPTVSIPLSKIKISQGRSGISSSRNGSNNYGVYWFLPFNPKMQNLKHRCDNSITLQEAFVKNKKDVILNVEARQREIANNFRVRTEKPKLTEDEALRVVNSRRKMRVYTKPLQISEQHHQPKQRQFTYRQIREHTEKLYRDLAEVVNHEELKRREEMNRCNRLMANIFGKRLLENVLKGKVSYGLQSQVPFIYPK